VLAKRAGTASSAPLGHVFTAPRTGLLNRARVIRSARCEACGTETTKRLCTECHFELTHDAGLVDDKVIAIIGGRNTGKSHYIATLVHKLEHEVGSNFGWSLRMVGDATRTRFENDFRAPLFRRKTVLQMTQSASVDDSVKTPMVFRLTFDKGMRRGAINLSFFDTAGEDMKSLNAMSVETRYITRAAGIIFLLDPLQIAAVRERLPHLNVPPADPHSEPTYLLDRLCDLFESQAHAGTPRRIDIPVAFVVSKIDAVWPIMERGSLLRQPGEHFGTLRRQEVQSIHTEVWNYLETWIGSGFNNRVEQAFSRFRYFAASALGRSPDATGGVDTVSSLRVEDPFLWILMELGFVRGH
jgi:hypothetical protein